MRFPTITVFTLTVLLAGGLSAQASDNRISTGTESILLQEGITTPTIPQTGREANIPSEALEQPLSVKAATSAQKSPLLTAEFNQNPQAVTENKVEVLAEASSPRLTETKKYEEAVLPKAEALRPNEVIAQSATNATPLVAEANCNSQKAQNSEAAGNSATYQLAQAGATERCPRPEAVPRIVVPQPVPEFEASPALSIYIPVGYGADRNTVFLSGSYQSSVREDSGDVGAAGIGIGLGDAAKTAGVELSYALETSENFGEGGFNAKVHRRLGQDLAGAIGWNGFLNFGRNDFEQSKYGVITKVFRTQESLNSPFSRVSVTAGVGDGQFRSNGAVKAGDNNVNVFGNVALRVIRPVSVIAEWTGQDLALGLSIAPFKNLPFVITPAVRDVAGAGDGARFVLGAGTAFRF